MGARGCPPGQSELPKWWDLTMFEIAFPVFHLSVEGDRKHEAASYDSDSLGKSTSSDASTRCVSGKIRPHIVARPLEVVWTM